MERYAMTLQRFQRRFRTEKDCVEHLFKLRWPDGYCCPRCGHRRYSFHSTRKLYQCCNCKYQVSVTAGTVFHKTRTPLLQWFWMMFIMTRQKSGVSMLSLQGMLGIASYKTVWTMGHKIRKAMADREERLHLKGLVETLETSLGRSGKAAPLGQAEQGPGRIVVTIEDRKHSPGYARIAHVRDMCDERIEKISPGGGPQDVGSRVGPHSDEPDKEVQAALDELNPLLISDRRPERIRWARILMANLKGNIRGVHHGVSGKHLHRYLAEFSYRFNRRRWQPQLVHMAIKACISASTITYTDLIA